MSRIRVFLVPVAALLLAACAGPGGLTFRPGGQAAPLPAVAAPFTTLAAQFTDRALKQERAGHLRQALDSWKVVVALRPETTEPQLRVADLSERLKAAAEQHYRDGLARLQEGNADAARRELLLTLAADPDHAAALAALKNRIAPDAVAHTVAAGESFEGIALQQYGDLAKAPIVARVNDLDPAGRPVPGSVLSLPGLAPLGKPPDSAADSKPARLGADAPPVGPPAAAGPSAPPAPPAPAAPKGPDPAETLLAQATELFQAKKFEGSAAAAEKLAGHAVVGKRARELAGNAWFAVGDAAMREERFADAVAAYRKAEPTRKDATAILAAVERRNNEKAEEFYNDGVRYFINQRLEEAIRNWEQTLALNPEHPKASKDIEKARGLQQKLKELR